jgi:hypothetical protein
MFTKSTILFFPIMLLALAGCGSHFPPIVNTKRDIEGLPVTQQWIRARGLADSDIPSLARLQELSTLDFAGGNRVEPAKITDQGLAELAKLDLPHLELLTLGWCDEITDAGLAHIVRMQTLKRLHLDTCPKVTDGGLRELVNVKNLTEVSLRGCPNITDDGIQQLAGKKNWTHILLDGCPKITPEGVAKLQAALPNVPFVRKDDQNWEYEAPHERSWRKE